MINKKIVKVFFSGISIFSCGNNQKIKGNKRFNKKDIKLEGKTNENKLNLNEHMIVAKYLPEETTEQFRSINPVCEGAIEASYINRVSLNEGNLKLYPNIQTQIINSPNEKLILNDKIKIYEINYSINLEDIITKFVELLKK